MASWTDDLPRSATHEAGVFRALQEGFADQYRSVFPDRLAERTVVVVPSLSLDTEVLERISGAHHYEERMLCTLFLLRMPRTRLVYITSQPIPDVIVDYYLSLMPGVPSHHARRRLTMIACHDAGSRPLSAKILDRPRLLARIRDAVADPRSAHLTCFTVSDLERSLAVQLGLPVFGCDPDLLPLGSKSGSRKILRESGVPLPDGEEDLADDGDIARALADLKARRPDMRRAVVKLNEGFSGEGNAIFRFPDEALNVQEIRARLPDLAFEAEAMTWPVFDDKIRAMGAIVEEFIEGKHKESPSAQYRIDPFGAVEIMSTHDQVLGGASGQIFLGCRFPADPSYRLEIQNAGLRVAERLAREGVLGRFAVDFLSVPDGAGGWRHYGIEINLRKGGTTHPQLMLHFLTNGTYDPETGAYHTPSGRPCFYHATDNLIDPRYCRLTPEDVIDLVMEHDLHYDGASQEGVAFHLIGALPEFGKLGSFAIAGSPERARALHDQTVAILNEACCD